MSLKITSLKNREYKPVLLLSIVALLVTVSRFGLTESFDLLAAAYRGVSRAIQTDNPLEVEIDRLEIILERLQRQIEREKHGVATALVALEDAEYQLYLEQQICSQQMKDIQTLHLLQQQLAATDSHSSTGHAPESEIIRTTLAGNLRNWDVRTTSMKTLKETVHNQRLVVNRLLVEHDCRRTQYQVLISRTETLRTRNAFQQTLGDVSTPSLPELMSSAAELADRIEGRIRVTEAESAITAPSFQQLIDRTVTLPNRNESEAKNPRQH